MAKSAAVILQRYERGIQNAGTAYKEGVQTTSNSWSNSLLAAKERMKLNYQNSINNGTFDRNVQRTGDSGWAQKTIAKASNYENSVTRAVDGYRARMGDITAVISEVQAKIQSMPRVTDQDRIQRMVANANEMKAAWARRNGV